MGRFFCVLLGLAIMAVMPATAQQFWLQGDRLPVGGLLPAQVTLPEEEGSTLYEMGITRAGSTDLLTRFAERGPHQSYIAMRVPIDPGNYQVVLRRDADDAVVQVAPLTVFFSPAPGALQLGATEVVAGGELNVTISFPQGQYLDRPWVGFFRLGENTQGGASIPDERISAVEVPIEGGAVTLTVPRWGQRYELRLFDRRNGPYVLDAAQIEVVNAPAPGILSLDAESYEIGSQLTSKVTLDKARYFHEAWVGLYRPERPQGNGLMRAEKRLSWQWVNRETWSNVFGVPSTVGTYEIRVFDRNSGQPRYELDRISFEVKASPAPEAIQLAQTDFIVGAPIDVSVVLPEGRAYYDSWVGLFRKASAARDGNAARSEHRYHWEWIKPDQPKRFAAPAWPGTYEFRLYDRRNRFYLLDTIEINVSAPPTPGVLELVKTQVDIGEAIKLVPRLEPNRFYSSPFVGIFSQPRADVAGGAGVTETRVLWDWAKDGEEMNLGAIDFPGTYTVRLYDRRDSGYVLDETEIEVVIPQTPDVLTLDKDSYRPGAPITVTLDLPEGRFTSSPWIGIAWAGAQVRDGSTLDSDQVSQHTWIKQGEGPYTLKAPNTAGTFRMVAMDRRDGGIWIGNKPFTVVPQRENLMRISGRQFAPGETIKVQVRWPEALPLFGPKVTLHESSMVLQGGGITIERPLSTHHIRERDEVVEIAAPKKPGRYEFRFVDRNAGFFILDIEEFAVVSPEGAAGTGTPQRLTPKPGEGRTLPASLPSRPGATRPQPDNGGLPGAPVLPSGGETAPANGETAPAGTDPERTDPETTETAPGTTPEGSAPGTDTLPAETPPAENPPEEAGQARLSILTSGPAGMVAVTRITPGQTFIVQASFPNALEQPTVTAQLSLAAGHAMNVTLNRDAGGVYRSGIIRLPATTGVIP